MSRTERKAYVKWEGNLPSGRGTFTVGSGAMQDFPVTWAARVERPDGKTSPEELLAAAHASCYAMASRTPWRAGEPRSTRLRRSHRDA